MIHRFRLSIVIVGVALLGVACGGSRDRTSGLPSPVFSPIASPVVIAAAPTQTSDVPPVTPSPTIPPTVTSPGSPLPPSATATSTPTETPGPYEHVIQPGDTCLGIAYEYGHLSPDVKRAIEQLNGIADCSILPGPGNKILVPRPTATATPAGRPSRSATSGRRPPALCPRG